MTLPGAASCELPLASRVATVGTTFSMTCDGALHAHRARMKKALAMILISGCATSAPPDVTEGSGAGGKADDGSSSGSITAWSVRPTRISTDHAVALLPAPDESRVAYSETAADYTAWGCWGRAGIGDLRLVSADSPGAPTNVSSLAGFRETAFTSDSASLVYTQYTAGENPCSDLVDVAAVPAAGGAVTQIHGGVTYYYKQLSVAGSTAVFSAFGGGANDPGTLYQTGTDGHGYGYLGTGAGKAVASQDPTGRALVYDAPDGHIHLRQLGATSDVDLSATYAAAGEPVWTPDGATLAISWDGGGTRSVTLMSRDGSNARTALTGCARTAQISPDGAWIACAAQNAVNVAPVAGGAQFSLTGLPDPTPSADAWWYFTPDSGFIHYIDSGAGFLEYGWFSAPLSAGSAFTEVTNQLSLVSETTTAAHDYLAYIGLDASYNRSLVVVKPNGDHTTVIASNADVARYEPAGARKLAAIANGVASIYATDGSGTAVALPGPASPLPAPFWKDGVLFYAVNKRTVAGEDTYDLIAASEDGSQIGVVLSGVTHVVTNSRMFLTRAQGVGGGVYVFDN